VTLCTYGGFPEEEEEEEEEELAIVKERDR
jgi:hypothetical protein